LARRTKADASTTRDSLLDAAEALFHEQGVARTSLQHIAQRAGVTRGAVYWHFKDKADLFHAMTARMTLPLEQACDWQAQTQDDALEYIRQIMRLAFSRVAGDAHTRRVFEILLLKVEHVGDLMALRERNMAALREFAARLQCSLEQAARQHAVSLRIAPQAAAFALLALFDGLLLHWLLARDFNIEQIGRQAVDGYLRGLGFCD